MIIGIETLKYEIKELVLILYKMKNYYEYIYNLNIINNKNYVLIINSLKQLNDNIQDELEYVNNIINECEIETSRKTLTNIYNKTLEIVNEYGYENISGCVEILRKSKNTYSILNKIEYIDNHFCVTRVYHKESAMLSQINLQIKKTNHPINSNNIYYNLSCATIELEIDDDIYIFEGFFKEDTLNDIYKKSNFLVKYNKITKYYDEESSLNKPLNYNKYCRFIVEYLNQLNVRDFILESIENIVMKASALYNHCLNNAASSISELVTEFVNNDVYQKRDMILSLLILEKYNNDNDDDDYNKTVFKHNKSNLPKLSKDVATKYTINSISSSNKIDNTPITIMSSSRKILHANMLIDCYYNRVNLIEYNNFINSIHYNLRKFIFANNDKKKKSEEEEEELTYEQKLDMLDISTKTRNKINDKIKEWKSAKDNTKAESYIESFFKIPFGKYIIEDIFIQSNEINRSINNMIKNINEKTNVQVSKNDTIIGLNNKLKGCNNKQLMSELIIEKTRSNTMLKEYMENVDKVLDSAVYGHKDSKREIKRLIAQWMNTTENSCNGTIIGFHGPPGVGKTCFAKKGIAECLKNTDGSTRPFCMFALGGASDGSVLEGHNYTYVGSKCGRLVEFLQESKCMNPVLYFDELDKISESQKGQEIVDILIHLTDKSQNKEIHDKYFSGIDFDFSKCIIIFSYNDASKINRILKDRINEIKINPLTRKEKIIITRDYTLKQIEQDLGVSYSLDDDIIEYLIDTYTYEAGVRKLNEKLYEIFREIGLRKLEDENLEIEINKELIDDILNRHHKIKHTLIHKDPCVGIINGLYASTLGIGGITTIQVMKIPSSSSTLNLELTGKLGEVMKESTVCAKTVANRLLTKDERNKLNDELKNNSFSLHIHCPDGATPKDGPSAGITLTTAIYSILTGKKIRNDIAMTGEIDLLGNVKAIGGLDCKINGAIMAGVKTVLFPEENLSDYQQIINANLLNGEIECIPVSNIKQVLKYAIIN